MSREYSVKKFDLQADYSYFFFHASPMDRRELSKLLMIRLIFKITQNKKYRAKFHKVQQETLLL